MPSLLAIYLTVAANQWHRGGKEMIQPRQAQERVGMEQRRRGRSGGGGGQRTDSSARVDKSDILLPCKLGQTRRTWEEADRN